MESEKLKKIVGKAADLPRRLSLEVSYVLDKGLELIPENARSAISEAYDKCLVGLAFSLPFMYAFSNADSSFLEAE